MESEYSKTQGKTFAMNQMSLLLHTILDNPLIAQPLYKRTNFVPDIKNVCFAGDRLSDRTAKSFSPMLLVSFTIKNLKLVDHINLQYKYMRISITSSKAEICQCFWLQR